MDLATLLKLKESENKVEFKAARNNFKYSGGDSKESKDRRHCVLGYVTAFCNEGGGMLVLGVDDKYPHTVVGSNFAEGNEGGLADKIYTDINIRVITETLFESDKRVLIIHVPTRPVGKLMKFESVPLMRIGESLREMSDAEMLKILSEQEPDFSATICEELTIDDLDIASILILKERYAFKQNNNTFSSLPVDQVLSDLDLSRNGKLTYAALILLGKDDALKKLLPQNSINLEFRVNKDSIHFDDRLILSHSFFKNIDLLWDHINLRNGKFPIQQGPYIFDIPFLNEEVVREAVHNAIVHRNYRLQSEIVIKQSDKSLDIISPGSFPLGVTVENILTVNSTPRNRLLADILLKTGIVERSGQGVDKLFKNTIQEAKGSPDYLQSDNFQVHLHIPTIVQDKAFVLFIEYIQKELVVNLSLIEVLTLEKIRQRTDKSELDKDAVRSLLEKNLIEPIGRTNTKGYMLSKVYYTFSNQPAAYTKQKDPDASTIWLQVFSHLSKFKVARIADFESLFNGILSREQVKYYIYLLVDAGILDRKGVGRGTYYELVGGLLNNPNAMQLGLEKLKAIPSNTAP
jgi:ATP-dependent DNA helicase RecG